MLKLSSSRGIRTDVPVLSVSWSFVDHSVIIQAQKKGLIEHEASDTGGVPRWKSSCPDRLAEATAPSALRHYKRIHYLVVLFCGCDIGTFYQGMLSTTSLQVIRYARRVPLVLGAALWEYYCTYPFDYTLADTRSYNRRCCGYSALQATGLPRYTIQNMILRVLCYEMWKRVYVI